VGRGEVGTLTGPPAGAWFNEIARFLGDAYWAPDSTRVQAFTTGTRQEVDFLVDVLALEPGMRVLDAGCGPGRHAIEFARRGIAVVGVDLSPEFVALARTAAVGLPAEFVVADVRSIEFDHEFDAVVCLCQGGFGLLGGGDDEHAVIGRFARSLRPGGRLALSAFSSYFVVRHLEAEETFDTARGVQHERTTIRGSAGSEQVFDLWTTCYTPRELRLLAERAGLDVVGIYGVSPGRYTQAEPSLDVPEFLLVAGFPKS